ncbi:site-specific DNA-methyltransferase [Streptococcus hyovaginalis]|uniref:site-specific DNA-methyltransferase n=1 Tax=Streptococcus hyovaginalis TaxID=149015 RepID=UPI002A7F3C82|nr:site-specific DNA-methyltransferase [Streptococcus hyovaginalis]MDY4511319.1 site-specific DNA-methyltransferase [Streptococcus hyovaginalis]
MTQFGDHTGVEKLNLASKDLVASNIQKLKTLFPAVITEGRDQDGHLQEAIDFDKLRQFLSREIVEGRESYEFTWVGKRGAIAEAGKPTTQTLRPDLEESVDFDKSENIFITGDNLEVLKVLQESYLGKIDMIYIDPPYNTGKDFVYSDKFQMSEEELADEMDLRDENGLQRVGLTKNEKSSARYHSDWLNMMYPRLVLARNLLKDSGVIFISIDDNEQANLKAICDEIFGEENFRNSIATRRYDKNLNRQFMAEGLHSMNVGLEYIFVYSKSQISRFNPVFKESSEVRSQSGYWKGFWNNADRPTMRYEILGYTPDEGQWKWKKELAEEAIHNYQVYLENFSETMSIEEYWKHTGSTKKFLRRNLNGNGKNKGVEHWVAPSDGILRNSNWSDMLISKPTGLEIPFDSPKNPKVIQELIKFTSSERDINILDFFAGSATTADAVMQLNAEDGGNRKYILCTLDEQVADKAAAKEAGYETIDQISRERIRRAAKKIQEEHPETVGKQDFGFRAYKLDSSNFKDVSQTPDNFSQESLFDSVSNIKDGRTDLDLLFQIMLIWGMELSLPIAKTQIDGTDIYNVADGALIACFADEISESVIRQIAKEEPLRAVFKDESFTNSAAKINLGQIFKEEAPNTKVKVV